jgi:hypothetical protein
MKIELTPNRPAGPHEPPAHHVLEDILASPLARRVLRSLTRLDNTGTCFFERACENYNNPSLTASGRWKWHLVEVLIDYGLKRAKLDKQVMTEKLFHHQPTVRSLSAGSPKHREVWPRGPAAIRRSAHGGLEHDPGV